MTKLGCFVFRIIHLLNIAAKFFTLWLNMLLQVSESFSFCAFMTDFEMMLRRMRHFPETQIWIVCVCASNRDNVGFICNRNEWRCLWETQRFRILHHWQWLWLWCFNQPDRNYVCFDWRAQRHSAQKQHPFQGKHLQQEKKPLAKERHEALLQVLISFFDFSRQELHQNVQTEINETSQSAFSCKTEIESGVGNIWAFSSWFQHESRSWYAECNSSCFQQRFVTLKYR